MVGAIDGELTEENLPDCDVVLVALYPQDAVNWTLKHIDAFKPGALVIDRVRVEITVTVLLSC